MRANKNIAIIRPNSKVIDFDEAQIKQLLDRAGFEYYTSEIKLREAHKGSHEEEIEEEINQLVKAKQLIINVRCILSLYDTGIENIDNAPTPSETETAFQALHEQSSSLYQSLIELPPILARN